MSRNNLNSPFAEKKYQVRLYKQGKHWVAMGVTLATLAGISFTVGDTASAAETNTSDATTPTVNENTSPTDSNTATLRTTADSSTPAPTPAKPTGTAISNNQSDTPTTDPAATPDVQAQIVTNTDTNGTASTDPDHTGDNTPASNVAGNQVKDNFSTGGSRRSGLDGPTVGTDQNHRVDGINIPTIDDSGTAILAYPNYDGPNAKEVPDEYKNYVEDGAIVANDAVNFKTNFHLNATVNVQWDPSMHDWLGGDGMAVAFQPVDTETALLKGIQGSGMGLVANQPGTISYIISTNALGNSPKDKPKTPNWVIYQSGSDTTQTVGDVFDTGMTKPQGGTTGEINYTFDVTYDANSKELTTNILKDTQLVHTFTQTLTTDQIGHNYVLGITGSTADSQALYTATINNYTYVPANAQLTIKSNAGFEQTGIVGTPGQVIAFYNAGTPAPTTDLDGNAISVAYAVPTVPGSSLLAPVFKTLTAGGVNVVTLNYKVDDQKINVQFVDNNGNSLGEVQLTGPSDGNVDYQPVFTQQQALLSQGYTLVGPNKFNDMGNSNGLANAPKTFDQDTSTTPTYVVVLSKVNNVKVTATIIPVGDDGQPIPNTTPTTVHDFPGTDEPVPVIPGYTTTTQKVTIPAARDGVITVIYTRDSSTGTGVDNPPTGPTTPTGPTDTPPTPNDNPAEPTGTTADTPQQTVTTPQITTESDQESASGSGTSSSASHGTVATGSQSPTSGSATITTQPNTAASPQISNGNQSGTSQNNQLPQTNEQAEQVKPASILGMIMLSLLSLFGISKKRSDVK
ncbi:KxYKxGKxW signal peptide domain-containing protein [Secundilactobacillus yichangensis]|uniref:KxYKxGKxW signal peptide domain-containing protein n=1 Tax=Secundilactobacillus yichangensis TaxID=2799580 RepID=UPI001941FE6C|nr:KxYKxGKxW signal peptide domain-containing protein [Secundilactobacillus yichangensis]